MKKYIILFICAALMLMPSCGAEKTAEAKQPEKNTESANTETAADIFGAITEIIGNMATIDLAVMPETGMPIPMNMNRPAFSMGDFDPENLPDGVVINEDGSVSVNRGEISGNGQIFFGGEMPENFDPENMPEGFVSRRVDGEGGQRILNDGEGGFSRDFAEGGMPGARIGMGGMMLEYTGEQKEFIIPVGLPIYALSRDEEGNETETEIELGDIKAGNAISVTYKEDGKTVDKILISQITALKPAEAEEMRNRINERFNAENTTESGDEE